MQSFPRLTLPLLLALPALLVLPACAGGVRYTATPVILDCAGRIPPLLRADVPSAPPPADNSVGQWVAFADGQTGALDKANEHKGAVVWIVDRCQAEALAAAKAIDTRPFWLKWTKPLKPG